MGSIIISSTAVKCGTGLLSEILITKPSGFISFRMIKEDFEFVKNHEVAGFDYYVDLTWFVLPNPLNLYYLRKLNTIPRLQKYIIVTDNPILKLLLVPLRGLLKYSEVIGLEEFEQRKGRE